MVYNLRKKKPKLSSDSNHPPEEDSEELHSLYEESVDDNSSDEDYDPTKPEYEDDEEDDVDDDDVEEEMIDFSELGRNYRLGTSAPPILFICPSGSYAKHEEEEEPMNIPVKENARHKKYSKEEKEYLKKLTTEERNKLIELETIIGNPVSKDLIPLRFKIISSPMEDGAKRLILRKLDLFSQMSNENSEYYKLKHWLENVSNLPFQKYHQIPVSKQDSPQKIIEFMNNTKQILDDTVYGHIEAKEQILRILAQWISNPTSHGHCIGIHGPMGIGKTSLIKDGLSKALGIPFGFVALGGATDSSFLEGHSYTYEGSTYGKISEILIRTQCSNPILFFDELDKVSATKKGEEIIGVLTHLTDISQNEKFNDKYFGELDLNLSRSLIVFSYNDETLINPILKDRLITIRVNGYKKQEKTIIAKNYLLPAIYKNFGMEQDIIQFSNETIEKIIDLVPEEQGVRNLKRGLECIVSWINMYRYLPTKETPIALPFVVTDDFILQHLTKKDTSMDHIHHSMYL